MRRHRFFLPLLLIAALVASAAMAAAPAQKRKRKGSGAKRPARASSVARGTAALPLREQIAQLIVATVGTEKNTLRLVRDLKVGGLLVAGPFEPYATAALLNRMQQAAKVPLLAAASPSADSLAYGAAGDPQASFANGAATARKSRAMGIHWVLAPYSAIGGPLSYGDKAPAAAAHVQAYVEGAHSDPKNKVLLCAMPFPGSGATVAGDRDRLNQVELVPFRTAIRNGVETIAAGNATVPAYDPQPANISQPILTGLLRKDLAFEGLIVASNLPDSTAAPVQALIAGADVILAPPDPDAAVDAVLKAVQAGRLPANRIEASAARLKAAKTSLGLDRERTVNLERIHDALGPLDEIDAAEQRTMDRAITLVRNTRDVFPVHAQACLFVMTQNRRDGYGNRFIQEISRRAPGIAVWHLDNEMTEGAFRDAFAPVPRCKSVIVAMYAPGSETANAFVEHLTTGPAPVGLVSFSDPAIVLKFPDVAGFVAAYTSARSAEVAAAKALSGEIPLQGHLPVSIPGYAVAGEGMQLPKAK